MNCGSVLPSMKWLRLQQPHLIYAKTLMQNLNMRQTGNKFVPCILMRSRIWSVFIRTNRQHFITWQNGFMDVILKQSKDLNNGKVEHRIQRTPDRFLLIWKTWFSFFFTFMALCTRSLLQMEKKVSICLFCSAHRTISSKNSQITTFFNIT